MKFRNTVVFPTEIHVSLLNFFPWQLLYGLSCLVLLSAPQWGRDEMKTWFIAEDKRELRKAFRPLQKEKLRGWDTIAIIHVRAVAQTRLSPSCNSFFLFFFLMQSSRQLPFLKSFCSNWNNRWENGIVPFYGWGTENKEKSVLDSVSVLARVCF